MTNVPAQEPVPRVSRLEPVRAGERVASVDVLRGVALLGILGMNIYAYALPWPAYSNPVKGGGMGVLDLGAWWFTHLLFEMKFMTLFSMLFGAGLALMAERAAARGARFGGTYYLRMAWLLLFGAVHGYLLWFGDILFSYALCGMALFPLRRVRPAILLPVGTALVLVFIPIGLGFGFFAVPEMQRAATAALEAQASGAELSEEQLGAIEAWQQFDPPPEKLEQEIAVYRDGYLGQVVFRAPLVFQFQTFFLLLFGVWRIGGLMIVGMALMKLGVFSAARSNGFYVGCCLIGYGVGLPATFLGGRALLDHGFDTIFVNQVGYLPNYVASLLVAMGHVGAVMLVCRRNLLRPLTRRLAAVGRMALSNYLAHTLICTSVFYGWGLGLFGSFGRFALLLIVAGIWVLQLVVSPPWLARFRFGPAEWLWRSLTYRKAQPMRL